MEKLTLVTENIETISLFKKAQEAGLFETKLARFGDINSSSGTVLVDSELIKKDTEVLALSQMSEELNKVIEKTLNDLQSLKKLHEQIVPIREEKIKGLHLKMKYGAGESSGGDFFDVIKGENELLCLMTCSSSYVVSSVVLSHFDHLRKNKVLSRSAMEIFLNSVVSDLLKIGTDNPKRKAPPPQCLIARIDLKRKVLEGFLFGQIEFLSTGKTYVAGNDYQMLPPFFNQAWFELSLNRGEKYLILSPGVKKNSSEIIDGRNYLSWLKDSLSEREGTDFLHEVFYQLKKNRERDFLTYDASVISIEVDHHVLIQV